MPELPEIHNFKRKFDSLQGILCSKAACLECSLFVAPLEHSNIIEFFNPLPEVFSIQAFARGKEFMLKFIDSKSSSCKAYKFNLGLSGKFQVDSLTQTLPVGVRLVFATQDKKLVAVLLDSQKMAKWTLSENWGADRGPDPVNEHSQFKQKVMGASGSKLFQKTRLAELLLNQSYFNGIGNYLRAEVLYRAKANPFMIASEYFANKGKGDELLGLCKSISEEVLNQGLNKYGTPAEQQKFQSWLQCYNKMASVKDKTGRMLWYDPSHEATNVPTIENKKTKLEKKSKPAKTKKALKAVDQLLKPSTLSPSVSSDHSFLQYLTEPGWRSALGGEFSQPYFAKILEAVDQETVEVFPPKREIFTAFNILPLDQIKVVLLGQDPYHDNGQAHGLCFSVKSPTPPPPSLVNIFKELTNDIPNFQRPNHGNLKPWARRGVFLLNAALTVQAHKPNSQ